MSISLSVTGLQGWLHSVQIGTNIPSLNRLFSLHYICWHYTYLFQHDLAVFSNETINIQYLPLMSDTLCGQKSVDIQTLHAYLIDEHLNAAINVGK